jgi:dihydroorotate dehydrogenase electron transfer subunit
MRCGQFVHIKPAADTMQLRRPFCLYRFDERHITLAIAVVGKGTERLSQLQRGEVVRGIVPLGNGFTLADTHRRVALVGGGSGCAPLVAVPQCYPDRSFRAYLGFADKGSVLVAEDVSASVPTLVSTDDGSAGFGGYVSEMLRGDLPRFRPDVILTCGPAQMLQAVAVLAAESGIAAYASLEARMGCGIGACLVCTCAAKRGDGREENVRVCKEGPVFRVEGEELYVM